jgi:hypothetical protein
VSVESITSNDANAALDTIFTGTQWVQLHTGHPGAAGTTSIATNNNRISVTWANASGGVKFNNADVLWTSVSTTETYTFFTIWSAVTAGTFHGSGAVTSGAVTAGNDFKIANGSLTITSTVAA